jgi:hypothetical protein
MCFSATASFLAAGVIGSMGIAAVIRAKEPRELPLAVIPILFAVQQGIEGLLWLYLPTAPEDSTSTFLTYAFLFFAEVLWPVYAPMTAWIIEPEPRRRGLMVLCVAVGVGVAGDLLWSILSNPHPASILDGHIVYASAPRHLDVLSVAYLIATGVAPIASSHRTVRALGAIILIGSAVAFAFYWEAFVSVWCFFAAAASGAILFHFEVAHRRRLQTAAV